MASNTPKFNISEIFYSIQGEGLHTGKAAVFIRLFGCNLVCPFCDEPAYKHQKKELPLNEIMDKVHQYDPCRFIVITGGEPSIQPDIELLIKELQRERYFVAVETNGTHRINARPDWISVSPKTEDFYYGDELKIIYDGQELSKYENLPFKHFYLQPMNHEKEINPISLEKCIHAVKSNPKWKLSLQIQKAIQVK